MNIYVSCEIYVSFISVDLFVLTLIFGERSEGFQIHDFWLNFDVSWEIHVSYITVNSFFFFFGFYCLGFREQNQRCEALIILASNVWFFCYWNNWLHIFWTNFLILKWGDPLFFLNSKCIYSLVGWDVENWIWLFFFSRRYSVFRDVCFNFILNVLIVCLNEL